MRQKISSSKPLIYLITPGIAACENFNTESEKILEIVKLAVNLKIPLIQIREKKLSANLLFRLTAKAADISRNSETKILVNDRADIALAAKADGVHLTENSLPPGVIRKNFPKDFIVGVSAHTPESLENAKNGKADFAVFSPIFETPGKGKPQGTEKLKTLSEKLHPFPVIALGGIDETNYRKALESGASGFAAIRFLNDAENLRKLSEEFYESLSDNRRS